MRPALRLAKLNEARLEIVYASNLIAQPAGHKMATLPKGAHESII